jgi:hypothetical protein
MVETRTSRLSLPQWSSGLTDAASRGDFNEAFLNLENWAARFDNFGTLANRPVAGVQRRFYFATDVQRLYLDTGTAWVNVGGALIDGSAQSSAVGTIAFLLKALAGQTASLLQVQDNSGNMLSEIGPNGSIYVGPTSGRFAELRTAVAAAVDKIQNVFRAGAADIVPLVARLAAAQTADGFRVVNSSGTILFRVDSAGKVWTDNADIDDLFGKRGVFLNDVAGSVPLIVQAAFGQTAKIQEWRNNTGFATASVNAGGVFSMSGLDIPSGTATIANGDFAGWLRSESLVVGGETASPPVGRLQEWRRNVDDAVQGYVTDGGVASFNEMFTPKISSSTTTYVDVEGHAPLIVLGPTDPVPASTPSGTVIVRKTQ